MKGKLLLSTLLLLCVKSFCQVNPTTFYFDKDLNISVKSKAFYTGEGKWENGRYLLDLYENKNHYHIFSAHYTDSTFAVMDGRFISYYNNGALENLSYYNKGKPQGLWIKWDADKKVTDSVWYNGNGQPDSSVNYSYHYYTRKLTSSIRNNFTDSSTIRTRYDEHEQPLARDLSDSIKVGEDKVVEKPDEEVAFPGSDSAMNSYFQYRFDQNKFALISYGTSGACNIRFKVDKNGRVSGLTPLYCDNGIFARTMEDAIEQIAWLPATKDGKPVTALKEVSEEFYPSLNGMIINNQRKYYFDRNFNATEPDEATFFGKITLENNMVKLTVHHYQHTDKVFSIHFTDSTLQICNGEFESYYNDDQKLIRGNFLLGRKNGVWLQWSDIGQVIDSSIYNIGVKTSETSLKYQPEGAMEAMNITDYAAGTKRNVFYDKRTITSDVTTKLYGESDGDTDKIFTKVEVEPSFPGGPEAWKKYLDDNILNSMDKVHRIGGCIIRFVIDTSGKVSNVEALTLRGSSIARLAIRVITDSPDWIPATQKGRKVKAYLMQSITVF